MKWGKLIFSTAFLGVSLASCGSKTTGHNPFDPKYEISYEAAFSLCEQWKTSVDRSVEYLAHVTVNNVEPNRQFRYKADYRGFIENEFSYVEGSIDTKYSSISDTDDYFRMYMELSDGFIHIEKSAEDYNNEYHYYLKDNMISVYAYGEQDGYGGYYALTFNNQGLVSFLEWYEFEGDLSGKETRTVTFESIEK